jgi:hypothetical protein
MAIRMAKAVDACMSTASEESAFKLAVASLTILGINRLHDGSQTRSLQSPNCKDRDRQARVRHITGRLSLYKTEMLLTLDDRLSIRELFGDGSQLEHLNLLVYKVTGGSGTETLTVYKHLLSSPLGGLGERSCGIKWRMSATCY